MVITCMDLSKPETLNKNSTEVLKIHELARHHLTEDDRLHIALTKPLKFKDISPKFRILLKIWIYEGQDILQGSGIGGIPQQSEVASYGAAKNNNNTPGGLSRSSKFRQSARELLSGKQPSSSHSSPSLGQFITNSKGEIKSHLNNNNHQYNITPSKNNKQKQDEAGSITSAHSIISAFSARKNKQGSIKSKVSGIYKKWKESSSFKSKDSVSVHNGMFAGSKLRPSIFRELGCVEINGKSLYHPVDIGDNHNGSQGEEKFTNYRVVLDNWGGEFLLVCQ